MLLPTTLLRHTPGRGSPPGQDAPHYDWLMVNPRHGGDARAGLWTARVATPWDEWPQRGRVTFTPLPPHRRRYLDWQGTLAGERGWVVRAARGQVQPHRWTDQRIWLTLHTEGQTLDLRLERVGTHWLGVCT
ncbi:MAG: hypothetical protein AAGG38_07825 [Planctomycetota bacterium]